MCCWSAGEGTRGSVTVRALRGGLPVDVYGLRFVQMKGGGKVVFFKRVMGMFCFGDAGVVKKIVEK